VLGRVNEAVIFTPQQLADAAPDVVLFALCGYTLDAAAAEAETAMRRIGSQWAAVPAVR
jgi:iron complex transport system substrate-binding protein